MEGPQMLGSDLLDKKLMTHYFGPALVKDVRLDRETKERVVLLKPLDAASFFVSLPYARQLPVVA